MPGGKGNITPSDGKQFSKDYQPAEKWTEEESIRVGMELIEWLKEKKKNIFFKKFLIIENNYQSDLIAYLSKKFTSFSELIETARDIQEIKLMELGCFGTLNSAMTKFTLINNHGWKDKKEIQEESTRKHEIDLSQLSYEQLKELAKEN